jgi:DNA-binding NarL/FixJ family response regulator
MKTRPIRILVAEDRRLIREALEKMLNALGFVVVATASDGEEAYQKCHHLRPDVVLMDLRMPRCDGVEATRRIRRSRSDTHVIVLTEYRDDESVFPALEAGAVGYLTKDSSAEDIAKAIESVAGGGASLEPSVQRRLLARYKRCRGSANRLSNPDRLSNREVEVVRLVAGGMNNREIAAVLGVSEGTIKTHLNNIFTKTNVADRANLVKYAYERRLVSPRNSDD